MARIIPLPSSVRHRLNEAARNLLQPQQGLLVDFSKPVGEPALVPPASISWRIFKNPVSLFVGGVAAVILELAEPSVRTAIWEHSTFRRDPAGRLRRTGLAAMVTVYGARSIAEPMIERVVGMHAKVVGTAPSGIAYSANDPGLLTWVHATAGFGFVEAYRRFVGPLSGAEVDDFYSESAPVARLYGASHAPRSGRQLHESFLAMRERLEPSAAIFEFLRIMRETPALPPALFWMQRMMVRAAVEIIPEWIRAALRLPESQGLRSHESVIVRLAGALSDRVVLVESPAVQASLRLGLPASYLYA